MKITIAFIVGLALGLCVTQWQVEKLERQKHALALYLIHGHRHHPMVDYRKDPEEMEAESTGGKY